MVLDQAEVIFVSKGRMWFRIFSDSPKDSSQAATESIRLGYNGKVQKFDCQDLTKGQRDDRHGMGHVSTWYMDS